MPSPASPAPQNSPDAQDAFDKITAITRTAAPLVWAAIVGIAAEWGWDITSALGDRPLTVSLILFLVAVALYLIAITVGKKIPWVERVILFSAARPTYTHTEPVALSAEIEPEATDDITGV